MTTPNRKENQNKQQRFGSNFGSKNDTII